MTGKPTEQDPKARFANIPFQIEADWDPRYAHLAGFPLNVLYSGVRRSDADGQPHVAAACYWFDPETYHEDEQTREMRYRPRERSPYHVRVIVRKDTGAWETFKYRGEVLLFQSSGAEFRGVMIAATAAGLRSDEPESDLGEQP